MLKITNLQAAIEEKQILKGINLEIKPGEVHARNYRRSKSLHRDPEVKSSSAYSVMIIIDSIFV